MATYVYETTDPTVPAALFEFQQSMKDDPYTVHPETGAPIRRVITGGYGYLSKGGEAVSAPATGGGCGSGCGCH